MGAALYVKPAWNRPSDKEDFLWSIIRIGEEGMTHPPRLLQDNMEHLYRQYSGSFTPPSWSSTIPVAPRVAKEDRLLSELQNQWGMVGLAVARGVIWLEMLSSIRNSVESSNPAVAECLSSLQGVINDHAAPPLAHTMILGAGYFNDLSIKCWRKIARAVKDPQLTKMVRGFTRFIV